MRGDPNDAPKAENCRWYKCEHCEHLHVILIDEDDRPIATSVLSREMLEHMLQAIDEPLTYHHGH